MQTEPGGCHRGSPTETEIRVAREQLPGDSAEQEEREGYDFFISYAHDDENRFHQDYAEELFEQLRMQGYTAFLDTYALNPNLGGEQKAEQLGDQLVAHIRSSRSLIVIAGLHAFHSTWVNLEIEAFLFSHRRPVFIVAPTRRRIFRWGIRKENFRQFREATMFWSKGKVSRRLLLELLEAHKDPPKWTQDGSPSVALWLSRALLEIEADDEAAETRIERISIFISLAVYAGALGLLVVVIRWVLSSIFK